MSVDVYEAQRLDALNSLRILDTPNDPNFDQLVQLAALICGAPIALVSLVDSDRQWFKARVGLAVSETPRSISFCHFAIKQKQIFIVPDAAVDDRFRDNPLVTSDPNIRFYAGAPLFSEEGHGLGTLCVIDRSPRELEPHQLEALRILANQAERLIQHGAVLHSLERTRNNLSAYINRMYALAEKQQAGILVEDRNREVAFANKRFGEIVGWTAGNEKMANLLSLHSQVVDPPDFLARTEAIRAAGEAVVGELISLGDGRTLEIDYAPLLNDDTPDAHMWTCRDISDRVRSQKLIEYQQLQLIEAQKLSSLGEMAGGLAHEINNPLTIIYGRTSHLLEMAGGQALDAAQVKAYAQDVLSVTDRIIKIIKGLRAFARAGDLDPFEPARIGTIVSETLEFCRKKIQERGIDLRLPVVNTDYVVRCRAVQISQILLNLINNSFDAVCDTPDAWIEIDAFTVSEELVLSVADSGKGIDPKLHASIFNPFFTTKQSHQGTGLGLSISQKIANEHGGSLQLDQNCPNTRFVLRLPLASLS